MTKTHDYALTEDEDGGALAHRLDCPMVAEHRAASRPVLTLLACAKPLVLSDARRHHCLDEP